MNQASAMRRHGRSAVVIAVVIFLGFASVAGGVDGDLVLRQVGDDIVGGVGDVNGDGGFGDAVALSADGKLLVVGEPNVPVYGLYDPPAAPPIDHYSGVVSRFRWDGSAWEAQTEPGAVLTAGLEYDGLGRSVALSADGSRIAGGAPGCDRYGSATCFVMTRDAGPDVLTYTLEGKWVDDGTGGDRFGGSVSMSADGNRLAVGAEGYVRGYEWDSASSTWVQLDPDIDGPENGFAFEVAISADGSRLVVEGTGDVVTFAWDDATSSWVEADRTDPAGVTALSGDGDRLVTDGGPGIATFDWDDSSSSWVRVAETSAFASSMALSRSGDRLVISDGGGDFGYDGTVAVFDWDAASASWVQVGSALDGAEGDIFGDSVAIAADGGLIAVGAPGGGYVRMFEIGERSSTTTTIPPTIQPPVTVLPETGGSTTTTITIVSLGLVVSGWAMLATTRRRSSTPIRDC